MTDQEHATSLDATPARQGRWGRHVAWVLLASTTLAAVALLAVWAWRWPDLQQARSSVSPADAARFDPPAPPPTPAPAPPRAG